MPNYDESRWEELPDGSRKRKLSYPETDLDATQAALDLAATLSIDLELVTGTGADGRITKGDVEEYAAALEEDA